MFIFKLLYFQLTIGLLEHSLIVNREEAVITKEKTIEIPLTLMRRKKLGNLTNMENFIAKEERGGGGRTKDKNVNLVMKYIKK